MYTCLHIYNIKPSTIKHNQLQPTKHPQREVPPRRIFQNKTPQYSYTQKPGCTNPQPGNQTLSNTIKYYHSSEMVAAARSETLRHKMAPGTGVRQPVILLSMLRNRSMIALRQPKGAKPRCSGQSIEAPYGHPKSLLAPQKAPHDPTARLRAFP